MNNNCNGDFYEVDGEKFYRCLLDGEIRSLSDYAGVLWTRCPNCERKIEAHFQGEVEKRVSTVTVVHIGRLWVEHSRVPVTGGLNG